MFITSKLVMLVFYWFSGNMINYIEKFGQNYNGIIYDKLFHIPMILTIYEM